MTEVKVYGELDQVETVAIIGIGARFAQSSNAAQFWKNLCAGLECVTFFDAEELIKAGRDPAEVNHPGYVRARPMLEDYDRFAASFFNVPPTEAELLDPQQRVFLECSWEALEDAAYDLETYKGWIGVFAGGSATTYLVNNLLPYRQSQPNLIFFAGINNEREYLATRVAYKLNLKGPSVSVLTACSTSLVATHLACQSLLSYQCDMALAGGVSVAAPQEAGYLYREGSIFSPDGHCRPFDAQAHGTIFGSGVGVVVLKRLSEALADGDHVYAVIKGSAVNNDGSSKVGFTAPGVEGQVNVISMAYQAADVDPETISYIETHGTGTLLGDPIEVEALTRVFRAYTDKKQFCALGSVKGCVGHTDAAAGVANLIATSLALKHETLPPSANYEAPNPKIDFENSPFYVNDELREWKTDGHPRRAGVSAFGIGGTNAHAILEQAPEIEPSGESRRRQQLVLSARSETALEAMTDNLGAFLQANPDLKLPDVAYTLHVGRQAFENRRMVICQTAADVAEALLARDPRRVLTGTGVKPERPVVFMFSGQGAQYVNMGRDLYQHEPFFREQVDACAELLQPHLGLDLRDVLYPAEAEKASEQLNQTWLTQPALFVIEYALAQLWISWGVKPQAMIGHSIGEYVAACLAGVLSLEDALAVVAARGRLMQSMPAGSMLSVPLTEAEVQPLLSEALTVATINAPSRCVVAGPTDAIAVLEKQLTDEGIACRRLFTSHAFHSPMMDPILEPFEEQLRQVPLQAPQIPYVSNLTGLWTTSKEATDPAYWAQHLRQAVRFSDGVGLLAQTPGQVLLEVGPGRTLRTLAQRHPDRDSEQIVLSSMRHPRDEQDDDDFLLHALGQLWLTGVPVDWPAFYRGQRRLRLSLPTYPFERQRYWIDPPEGAMPGPVTLSKHPNVGDWFYVPSWKRTMPPLREPQETRNHWLFFGDGDSLSAKLAQRLQAQGHTVVIAHAGDDFAADGDVYTVRPAHRDDYDALLAALDERDQSPTHIVHLWNVAPIDEGDSGFSAQVLQRSFYSLLYLAQALGARSSSDDLQLAVVGSNVQKITSEEFVLPEKATLLGPCKVISQEMPHITTHSIDVVLPQAGSSQEAQLVEHIIAELETETAESVVAYRGYDRWAQTYEPVPLAESGGDENSKLRPRGVYLITGGLGGIGLALAEYLAQAVQAKLVLTSRSRFPAPETWEQWLATHVPKDRTSLRIQSVQALEALGAEVLVVQADVTDRAQMKAAVGAACERFGTVHGVIHSAGLPGGGVMQLKAEQAAAGVLAPKVEGTRVLEAVLRDIPLDFMVLCSSLTAITGGLGQVDYCAANAFMDAFAHARNGRNGTLTVSVNWDAWAEVGMAVNTAPTYATTPAERAFQSAQIDHPVLDCFYQETDERAIYQMELSPAEHWVLSDHILLGIPTIPGTTHLELARAAFVNHTQRSQLEIREAIFLVPMMVGQGDSKEAHLILEDQADGFKFEVKSNAGVTFSGETEWQTHVIGQLGHLKDGAPKSYDVAAIRERCSVSDVAITLEDTEQISSGGGFLLFGPRWHCLKRVNVGQDEAIALLELKQEFSSDVQDFKLHPALLDIATSFVAAAAEGNLYLPLSYKRARIYEDLPPKFYSYVRRKAGGQTGEETMTLQVTLLDQEGRVLMDVDEFTMSQVKETAASRLRGSLDEDRAEAAGTESTAQGIQRRGLGNAISPQEGVEAFRRILFRNRLPQIAVSTRHLPTLIQRADEFSEARLIEQAAQVETVRAKHPRPNLQTPYVAPRNKIEEDLALVWEGVLGIEQVGIHDNFFELGGDSVMGIQVVAKVRDAGLHVDPEQLFQHQTIAELAELIDVAPIIQIEPDVVTGSLPLTPAQHWFFEHDFSVPHHWNLVMLSEMERDLVPSLLERALRHLLTYHDALRLRFVREEPGWQPSIVEFDNVVPFLQLDLSALPGEEQELALEAAVAELKASLNLTEGPLMRVAVFDLGAQKPNRLLTIVHHLVSDAFSWWILMDDLQTAYQQLSQGEAIQLTPKTTSCKRWAEKLLEYAQSEALYQESDYWLAESRAQVHRLPMDYPEGQETNVEGTADIVSATLDAQETQVLLQEVPNVYHTQVNVLLLTALYETFAQWTGERTLLVDLWIHGREPIFENVDLSRTVGWVATPFPLLLNPERVSNPGDVLKSVKEHLHEVPKKGIGYGLLRYLSGNAAITEKLCALPRPDVSFNYVGQSIPMPSELGGQSNFSTDPQNGRLYLLDVIASVVEDELEILVKYSKDVHQRPTMENLAQGFVEALQRLIQHCRESDTVHFTPSDFPEAGLDQDTLDQFLTMLNKDE